MENCNGWDWPLRQAAQGSGLQIRHPRFKSGRGFFFSPFLPSSRQAGKPDLQTVRLESLTSKSATAAHSSTDVQIGRRTFLKKVRKKPKIRVHLQPEIAIDIVGAFRSRWDDPSGRPEGGCGCVSPTRGIIMDSWKDQRMLEAILCTLLGRAGGRLVLSVPDIAAHSSGFRICPQADRQGQTLTLTLEVLSPEGGCLHANWNGALPLTPTPLPRSGKE